MSEGNRRFFSVPFLFHWDEIAGSCVQVPEKFFSHVPELRPASSINRSPSDALYFRGISSFSPAEKVVHFEFICVILVSSISMLKET